MKKKSALNSLRGDVIERNLEQRCAISGQLRDLVTIRNMPRKAGRGAYEQ